MVEPLSLGVTLSLRDDARAAFARLHDLGLPTAQIYAPESNLIAPGDVLAAAGETGAQITSVIAHFAGESYTDIPTVSATVGLVPEATREARVSELLGVAAFAKAIGVRQVQAHIGFIPEDASDARYAPLVAMTQEICDQLSMTGQVFALETGQETAATLLRFLNDVERANLRVNFDPANMILYGNDNPLKALELLFPFIESVHAKDGAWPTEAQKSVQGLGTEMPLGEGDVDIPRFLTILLDLGYRGAITIEREIEGEAQKLDILKGKALIERTIADWKKNAN
jgi:sugar phosphate isomerase/epimerase